MKSVVTAVYKQGFVKGKLGFIKTVPRVRIFADKAVVNTEVTSFFALDSNAYLGKNRL